MNVQECFLKLAQIEEDGAELYQKFSEECSEKLKPVVISFSEEEETHKKIMLELSNNEKLKEKQLDQYGREAFQKQVDEKNKLLEEKYQKGYEAFRSKQYVEAIRIEDEVLKEDNNHYKAYNVKGIALCFNNNFDEGMASIDKSLNIKPDFGYARFNKALAYELYEKFDEALAWYEKALQVENYIWSYYGEASIYGRRGDVANTVKYLKIAIDMDSSVKATAKEESDFNSVRDSKEFEALVN